MSTSRDSTDAKDNVLFPQVEMKSTAISKMARLWKQNAPSEFNPPLCPSFLPLIPLEEARYSSRYCPQARPVAPQAAPRADRAPMQSRARFASDTYEDHRIQTRPRQSKSDLQADLGVRKSSRARSSSCRSSPDRLGSEQCSSISPFSSINSRYEKHCFFSASYIQFDLWTLPLTPKRTNATLQSASCLLNGPRISISKPLFLKSITGVTTVKYAIGRLGCSISVCTPLYLSKQSAVFE